MKIQTNNSKEIILPSLFGQIHSSRDYTKPYYWGKNQFNSSFPASLVAYMSSKGIKPVYLCTDKNNNLLHKYITGERIFGINPLSLDAYYNFEAGFSPFETYYTGDREKIDLVMLNNTTKEPCRGLEIKLTALPDNSTKYEKENKYSCEIVVRPPTICFIACSICANYSSRSKHEKLQEILKKVPQINNWSEIDEVAPKYELIKNAVISIAKDMWKEQEPLIIQPVWKTDAGKMRLAQDCLDVFVWSNIATLQMCINEGSQGGVITRFQRTIIWIYKMLLDYSTYDKFDYVRIIKNQSYGNANDKAFALSGKRSYPLLKCKELTHPRIGKDEIRNIILGGGQNLLSPERRFDAVIVNSPDLFE